MTWFSTYFVLLRQWKITHVRFRKIRVILLIEGHSYETLQRSLFLLAIYFGVDTAQKTAQMQKIVICAHATNQQRHCNYGIHAQSNENKTKHVQGQGPSNINLSLFVCFFDVYPASQPYPSMKYGVILRKLNNSLHKMLGTFLVCKGRDIKERDLSLFSLVVAMYTRMTSCYVH